MMNQFKVVVMCSAGSRTGGPEASFQLVNELNELGLAAQIWLVTQPQITAIESAMGRGERIGDQPELLASQSNGFEEYAHYLHTPFDGNFDSKTQFVVAEKYLHLVPYLLNARPVVWWLSVDNAFQSLAKINLNFLRLEQVRHLHQCEYAHQVLSALGMISLPVYDYTVVDESTASLPVESRPMRLALNAGRKVIFPLKRFSQQLTQAEPGLEVVLLQGLERQQVYDTLRSARLFYDMGSFPGNDRMYREAALFGTPVMALRVAGAASGTAEALADLYRPHAHEAMSGRVAQQILHMLRRPKLHAESGAKLQSRVRQERAVFREQVMQAFLGA